MKFLTEWFLEQSVCELIPRKIEDSRGFFSETYQKNDFAEYGILDEFMQENHSFTKYKHTFRGLHFQKPPYDQSKLVRVLKGSILDIVVDLRRSSPTYLKNRQFHISAENFKQIYIPSGFAHGFLTLEDNCEISYKVSNPYNHSSDVSLSVFDQELGITLPCLMEEISLSKKDAEGLTISKIGSVF